MTYFTSATFDFLRDLAAHNDRAWFEANRPRYREHVLAPAVRFILDFGPRLRRISPHFRADPRPTGGSLFRIHRDTRFSKDKSPYKTHIGVQFRHEAATDVHAPGFYLHIEPENVFAAVGLWRPDAAALQRVRQAIVANPESWRQVLDDARFARTFALRGEVLSRAPRGYDAGHALIGDIRRKEFVAVAAIPPKIAGSPEIVARYAEVCRAGSGLMRFLCGTLALEY